jgi:hypothetical protein
MARIMVAEYKTSDRFWVEAINTTYHATNCLYLHKLLKKTSYEFSEVSVIFYKRGQSLLNLLIRLMKVSYLVMIQTLGHSVFSM